MLLFPLILETCLDLVGSFVVHAGIYDLDKLSELFSIFIGDHMRSLSVNYDSIEVVERCCAKSCFGQRGVFVNHISLLLLPSLPSLLLCKLFLLLSCQNWNIRLFFDVLGLCRLPLFIP